MKVSPASLALLLALAAWPILMPSLTLAQSKAPAQTQVAGPDGLPIIVRMPGPYDAEVTLRVVCYFKRTPTSDSKL